MNDLNEIFVAIKDKEYVRAKIEDLCQNNFELSARN